MLEVKKCGSTKYGYWAIGNLKYNGLTIKDIFSINKEVQENSSYKVLNINISRNNNGVFKIKLEI